MWQAAAPLIRDPLDATGRLAVEVPLNTEAPRHRKAWLVALAALVLTLLLAVFVYLRSVRADRSQYVEAAQVLLERHRLSWEGREPVVVCNGDEVTVTFPPPKGARAGEFIIRMERETKKILDVKIWR